MKDRQRWQPEEDALLRAYVKQYGPKEWNHISSRMGTPLDRDPKSCLERWKNYLKPGIKKGSLTPDEQSLVISLQAKYGNKWKKIAAEVPGRTAKRLGKWWEVLKEKQMKQLQKSRKIIISNENGYGRVSSPEKVVVAQGGKYDHILETFAEKYVVQPNVFAFQSPMVAEPVLSLGSVQVTEPVVNSTGFPSWMTTSSLTSSSSTTASPSVSLTLSPSEPAVLDPVQTETARLLPVLIQHCKEVEEGRENWMRHRKEATWRLSRLEQQLESEKARRRKEKTEEIEERIRRLREEEAPFVSRLEVECKEEVRALIREDEAREARLMEAWCSNHVKLGKLVEKIGGAHGHGGPLPK